MAPPSDDDDCWNAFGSDNEDNDDTASQHNVIHEQGILWLMQYFLSWNPTIFASQRRVYCRDAQWTAALQARGMQVVTTSTELVDAVIVSTEDTRELSRVKRNVVPNGAILTVGMPTDNEDDDTSFDDRVWSRPQTVCDTPTTFVTARIKHPCLINQASCPWLPSTHSLEKERQLLQTATITPSAMELLRASNEPLQLTQHDVQRASTCLSQHGYCIVRNLLDPKKCLEWGSAVLHDLQQACDTLQERDGIHLKSAGVHTTNYRELAMREDLRMDLRDGPHLRAMRRQEAQQQQAEDSLSTTVLSSYSQGTFDSCLQFHPTILEIVQRTMNPRHEDLYQGNVARYNFNGSGPDGSPQPIKIGPMGGIASLPGSADQALHADTPHLFEHIDCLPAHYINAFCLGIEKVDMELDQDGCATGSTPVGGTAFIHDSHKLSFTASAELSLIGNEQMLQHLVRPSLQLGDAVLFDCRILHFGLANNSQDIERPLLYTNMTHSWFVDPKNWNDRQRIFNLDQE
jgi:ectoine hydroxylase-related dioxygenase (phytanoyl-CoA dioxygenase family)